MLPPSPQKSTLEKDNPNPSNPYPHIGENHNPAKTKSNLLEVPSITLPKGGGAIKSIDEKFQVNPVNGTASFSLPFPASPGRNGFTPALALGYSSGGGNGLFGLGWSMDAPSIQRKTDKQLPRYNDAEASDVFVFSGAEDLVPYLDANGVPLVSADGTSTRYRPRIEGGFAKIEQIREGRYTWWKVTTRDNVVSVFGQSPSARLADPSDDTRIFQWLLEYSHDDKGNFTEYGYKSENLDNVAPALHEKNRLIGLAPVANTYLKRIRYGNVTPFYAGETERPAEFLFEIVLDYGEHDLERPTLQETQTWPARPDAFSDYRAGFEIRTWRLCRRVLMFHHFQEELGLRDYLVRSLDFTYTEHPHLTYLEAITQTGYIWNRDGTLKSKRALPPQTFQYQKLGFNRELKSLSPDNLANLPYGLDGSNYQWTDLYSEGISGILTEQGGGWYYKENLGDGAFTPAKLVAPRPSFSGLAGGSVQLQELEANGVKYLVSADANTKGYFELNADAEWQGFRPFEKYPTIDLRDPNVKFLDLNGDGLADILITEDEVFHWYQGKGKLGYDDHATVRRAQDEERGPKVLFAEKDERILVALADMSGDGLSDIVRISNSEVCYWPNLGYGRFGAKVTLGAADLGGYRFAQHEDLFNPQQVQLADIDGTGTTDIIYLGDQAIKVWFNQSGNRLSAVEEMFNPFPKLDNQSKISVLDLLGTGTSCIVWSSSLPEYAASPLRYIDLTAGQKPHVMTQYLNNLGKEVSLRYRSSTHFYLQDKKLGKPWITKLPFPVQCVQQVIVEDKVSQTRFANEYSYHHGYYDGLEREFRGFALVVQRDTEEFEHYVQATLAAGALNTTEQAFFQPAVITKTWFHTGAFIGRDRVFHQLQEEYYPQELVTKGLITDQGVLDVLESHLLPEAPLPTGLNADEWPECLRALKGLPLRQEVYSDEGDEPIRLHPYSVTQYSYDIQRLQSKMEQRHAVFFPLEKEKLSFQYERNPLDPRIAHSMNLSIDVFGNVLQAASIVYGRQMADPQLERPEDRAKQQALTLTFTENNLTNLVDLPTGYRLPLLCETRTWDLSPVPKADFFFTPAEITTQFNAASPIPYFQKTAAGQKRLVEHLRTVFQRDNLTGLLPLGSLESLALPGQAYQLALTPDMLPQLFDTKVNDNLLRNTARYVRSEGDDNYWIASGRVLFYPDLSADPFAKSIGTATAADLAFAKRHFFAPLVFQDNFGQLSKVFYEPKYKLYIERMIDALDNETWVEAFHYRTLGPLRLRDANDNRMGVRFDELGLVTHTFVMGKANEQLGDFMDLTAENGEFSPQDDPTTRLSYEFRYLDSLGLLPNRVKMEARETHRFPDVAPAGAPPSTSTVWQVSYSYSDGSGHEVLKKIQAEPGEAPLRTASGQLLINPATGYPQQGPSPTRWVGNGRTILNNKGNPVKQYEPFFDSSPEYNQEQELVQLGHTPLLFYDALSRPIRTEKPNGTFSKVEFTAWLQRSWDENDTVLESRWYSEQSSADELDAAAKAAVHSETPTLVHLDSLGRTFLSVAHNKTASTEERYSTRSEYDIEGNILRVRDARDNPVMTWFYDMLGNVCRQESTDAGTRWQLNDAMGKPIRTWDSRQHTLTYTYDNLHRPLSIQVNAGSGDQIVEQIIYGEGISAFDPRTQNLRGKAWQHRDTAGLLESSAFDFKGNLLRNSRQLLQDFRNMPNWASNPALETEAFVSSTRYDALNRPVEMTTPDQSVVTPRYNEANLLKALEARLRGSNTPTPFVRKIDYNAKGQRTFIEYGNNSNTRYTYDPVTDRLLSLRTNANAVTIQDLNYTYDPVGNITRIEDKVQETVFYNWRSVDPINTYTYDALYRLIGATGREHLGQMDLRNETDNWHNAWELQPNNARQMRYYEQYYTYDAVGNITKMQHVAGPGSWTRQNQYNSGNNQLTQSNLGSRNHTFSYNAHGSMSSMPHLSSMDWNFKEELAHAVRQDGSEVWYVYDSSGQRVRKMYRTQSGVWQERIYLGGYEVYRERSDNGTLTLERESLHLMDGQQRIALIETRTQGNDGSPAQLQRYQYSNHLGTACLELDGQGTVISYEEFHPYGTTAYQAVNADIRAAAKRYRYTGMERDEETGLGYHRARYLVVWLGRWGSVDPKGIVDGINIFSYSQNNPITFFDSNGFVTEKEVDEALKGLKSHVEKRNNLLGQRQFIQERLSENEKAVGELSKLSQNQSIDESQYEKLFKEHENLMNQLQEVEGFLKNINWIIKKDIKAINSLKRELEKGFWNDELLDEIQSGLDWVGFTPVGGVLADVVNAGFSFGRGKTGEGFFNLASAIPGIGDAAKAVDKIRDVAKTTEKLHGASKVADKSGDAAKASKKGSQNESGGGGGKPPDGGDELPPGGGGSGKRKGLKNFSDKIDPDISVEKQLERSGQLSSLKTSPNIPAGINVSDLLRKTPREIESILRDVDGGKRFIQQINKAFQNRDLRGRVRGKNR